MNLTVYHPNISMYILQTVPYSFSKVLTRKIFLNNQESVKFLIISLFSWP